MQLNTDELFTQWHWSECLNYLDNIIRYSDNLVLISGAHNSGKTTLKQELIKLLGSNCKIFSTFGEQQLNMTTFIRNITEGFGLLWQEDNLPTWDKLQTAILSNASSRWILIIDDADKIPWDHLNALIRLYTVINSQNSQLSILLFAHSNLEYSLKQSVLKDLFEKKFQKINLQPLTFAQMIKYLHNIKINLDSKHLKQIYEASAGYIGEIKKLAISKANLENVKYNIKDNIMQKDLLIKIINSATLKVICCSFLVVSVYVLFGVIQKNNLPTPKLELEQIVEPPIVEQATIAQTIIAQPELQVYTNSSSEELYQKLYNDLQNNLQQYMQSELNKLEQQVADLKMQLINNTANTATTNDNNILDANKLNNTENNLLSTAKNRYTLQIMAAKDEYSVKKLFNNYPQLLSKAKYFRAKFRPEQASTWFVVVHGSYANRELAINDIKNLPVDIQTLKPIVRNYNYIHQIINNKSLEK